MRVLAFDVFGTIFDLSGVPRQEVKDYVQHIRQPEWKPLQLPASWENLPIHADVVEGLYRLRTRYFVVTCSNGPLGLLAKLSKNAGITWDAIIPLELNRVFKPNSAAYLTVCQVLGVRTADVTMVTANKDFGDLEAAKALGMEAIWIRNGSEIVDTVALAELLGC